MFDFTKPTMFSSGHHTNEPKTQRLSVRQLQFAKLEDSKNGNSNTSTIQSPPTDSSKKRVITGAGHQRRNMTLEYGKPTTIRTKTNRTGGPIDDKEERRQIFNRIFPTQLM